MQVAFPVLVTLSASIKARVTIVNVAVVPFSMNPIVQFPVSLLYVPFCVVQFMNATSAGSMSLSVTFVALVPLFALVTVMVQVTMSPTK